MWHWWYFNFPGKVQFGVKEKRFGIRVFCVHGGSNREEITRFAVKRLNVPLLATVTVMPHTTFPLALLTHSHMTWWYHNIWWFLILSTLFELHSIIVLFPHFFHFPKFHLIAGRESSPLIHTVHCSGDPWILITLTIFDRLELPWKANEMCIRIFLSSTEHKKNTWNKKSKEYVWPPMELGQTDRMVLPCAPSVLPIFAQLCPSLPIGAQLDFAHRGPATHQSVHSTSALYCTVWDGVRLCAGIAPNLPCLWCSTTRNTYPEICGYHYSPML